MSGPRTVAQLLELAERVLHDSSHLFDDHDYRREAEDLLAFCLGIEIGELDDGAIPPRRTSERFLSLVARRAGGEPFPHLTGTIEFYGLRLEVRPGPFVPRPSSELTVEQAVKRVRRRKHPTVVDVCTGAGPIALAIADAVPDAEVWGSDIDDEGLSQARRNAKRLAVANVRFRRGDMYGALPRRLRGAVDVITGHIPYVPLGELEDLPTEVRGYEPAFTLTDQSSDGLDLIRIAIRQAPEWLKPGGWLLLEVSDDLPPKLERLMRRAGIEPAGVASDEDELSVIAEGRMPR